MSSVTDFFNYRLWKWEASLDIEAFRYITLEIGLPAGRFIVDIHESRFVNSPERFAEFGLFYQAFRAKGNWAAFKRLRVTASAPRVATDVGNLCLNDCVEWVLPTLLAHLPSPKSRVGMQLDTIWRLPWSKYIVSASDDLLTIHLHSSNIQRPDTSQWTGIPWPSLPTSRIIHNTLYTRLWKYFTIFSETAEDIIGDQPHLVRLDDDPFRLESFEGLTTAEAIQLILKYDQINYHRLDLEWTAKLSGFVLSQSFRLVCNDKARVVGPLIEYVPNLVTLRDALQMPMATHAQKTEWRLRLFQVLEALHEKDIIWNGAQLDRIMVDPNGCLHIRQTGLSLENLAPHASRRDEKTADRNALISMLDDPLWA